MTFFIIGILVISILSLGFISILEIPPSSIQLTYSSKGGEVEKGSGEEDSKENGKEDSNDKSFPSFPSDGGNEEEEGEQEEDNNGSGNPPLSSTI